VTGFKVKVTNTQYVSIAPSEMFVNNTERYVEVISLQFTGVGLFGAIMPSIGLMRPVAQIAYAYGFEYEEPDEIAYPVDLRTYRAQSQFWTTHPTVVKVDGVMRTDGYTVNATEGTVTFASPLSASSLVQLSYGYRLPCEVRDAVGAIASYILGLRETRDRGMGDISSIKVNEVTITKHAPRGQQGVGSIAAQLSTLAPEAALLLDGMNFITIR
jgi:hypothetical protein